MSKQNGTLPTAAEKLEKMVRAHNGGLGLACFVGVQYATLPNATSLARAGRSTPVAWLARLSPHHVPQQLIPLAALDSPEVSRCGRTSTKPASNDQMLVWHLNLCIRTPPPAISPLPIYRPANILYVVLHTRTNKKSPAPMSKCP